MKDRWPKSLLAETAFKLALLILAFCAVSCRSLNDPATPASDQQDPSAAWTPKEAYDRLVKIKCFTFGGVGYAGRTSPGESAFRAVLKSDNAEKLFKTIMAEGTPEARLYALCGIRILDRKSFSDYADPLYQTNPAVTTMSGCMITRERAGMVVGRIEVGDYDRDFKQRLPSF